jgi:hypothetical protein
MSIAVWSTAESSFIRAKKKTHREVGFFFGTYKAGIKNGLKSKIYI